MNVQDFSTSDRCDDATKKLAQDLIAGRIDTLGRLFAKQGLPAPVIVWNPIEQDVAHPILGAFTRAVAKSLNSDGQLTPEFLQSEAYMVLKDWTIELEPAEDLSDFTYVHYGREIARTYGKDMTGRNTSDFGGYISTFFMGGYLAVLGRSESVMTQYEPPRQAFIRNWRRVVVPVYETDGRLYRMVVAIVSDNELRAGLEVLPDAVLVATATGEMCFANRPACELFAQPRDLWVGKSVEDFTGVEVNLSEAPEALVRQGHCDSFRRVVLENGIVTPIEVSVSATFYRNEPFYVIMARRV